VVEASRRDGRLPYRRTSPFETVLTPIPSGSMSKPNETELEEAGARRLLAAVDELNDRREGRKLAESASQLKRRRERLWASLPALSQTRADTYRLNSDALTLGRSGATYQDPQKMAQLGEAEVTADDAMRRVQREIRQLDEEIGKIGGAS